MQNRLNNELVNNLPNTTQTPPTGHNDVPPHRAMLNHVPPHRAMLTAHINSTNAFTNTYPMTAPQFNQPLALATFLISPRFCRHTYATFLN